MTSEDLKPYAALAARHMATATAGLLAGYAAISPSATIKLEDGLTAMILGVTAVGWSAVNKAFPKAIEVIEAAPASDISQVATTLGAMHDRGASPALVGALAQSLGALVMAELQRASQPQPQPKPLPAATPLQAAPVANVPSPAIPSAQPPLPEERMLPAEVPTPSVEETLALAEATRPETIGENLHD